MSAFAIALLLVCIGMAGMVIFALGKEFRRQAERLKPPAYEPTPKPDPWRALPGGRLELAATGFAIEHRPADPRCDFFLYSPEGQFLCAVPAGNLAPLKQLAERMADERREFEPDPVQSFPAFGPRTNHDR